MSVRGIRGATVVNENSLPEVINGTRRLLEEIMINNPDLRMEDIASVIFTATEDLDAAYPAAAARELGWDSVPLLCAKELTIQNELKMCIRVLVHWNTEKHQNEVRHTYIGEAGVLRPDLSNQNQAPDSG